MKMKAFIFIVQGVLSIFLMGGIGYLLAKLKIINSNGIDFMNKIVLTTTYPCFILFYLPRNLASSNISELWILPILGLGVLILGFLLSSLYVKIFKIKNFYKEIIGIVTFNNGAYLPIPLAFALLRPAEAEKLYVYIILFVLLYNPLMWTFGVYLLSRSEKENNNTLLKKFLNPPTISIVISIIIYITGIYRFIPQFILNPIKTIGDITIPILMLSIGSMIGTTCLTCALDKFRTTGIIVIKLLIMPAFGFIFISLFNFPYLIKLLIILETSMPPAMNIPVIARIYGDNETFVTQAIFYSYIVSMFTISIFYFLFQITAL